MWGLGGRRIGERFPHAFNDTREDCARTLWRSILGVLGNVTKMSILTGIGLDLRCLSLAMDLTITQNLTIPSLLFYAELILSGQHKLVDLG